MELLRHRTTILEMYGIAQLQMVVARVVKWLPYLK